jgi:kynurenine formamidase
MPIYGGEFYNSTVLKKSISKGDSCNESEINISFHIGSHVDFPWHFIDNGKKGSDYNYFIKFKNPTIVYPKIIDGLMYLNKSLKFDDDSECILIVAKDLNDHNLETIGLSLESAKTICDTLPNLKAIFLNTVSISSINKRQIGRDVHKFILGKGILIYEDCDFSKADLVKYHNKIYTFHIFGLDIDGSPCVIFSK